MLEIKTGSARQFPAFGYGIKYNLSSVLILIRSRVFKYHFIPFKMSSFVGQWLDYQCSLCNRSTTTRMFAAQSFLPEFVLIFSAAIFLSCQFLLVQRTFLNLDTISTSTGRFFAFILTWHCKLWGQSYSVLARWTYSWHANTPSDGGFRNSSLKMSFNLSISSEV